MAAKRKPGTMHPASSTHPDGGLVGLVELLQTIDVNGPLTKTNAVSIADNNGGRIEL